jgi:hypothetical protein
MRTPGPVRRGGWPLLALATLGLVLAGCAAGMPRPDGSLDRSLDRLGVGRAPALSGRWLALLAERNGRRQVVLVDVERQRPLPLSGLNRPDALPLSVAVDNGGGRLAVVRQIGERTELVLYRRSLGTVERIPMRPPAVPRRVSLRADGRELAVEVSRGGRPQVDLIRLP